jgi:MFS family permease
LRSSFHALKNRNYRLYFSGQLISVVGNGMQLMVQSWLVYRLTHSAYWLGLIAFCSQVPAFFTSPMAGIIADHKDRRQILIWVQIIGMLQSFTLAALVFAGTIQAWQVAVLSVLLGVLNAFEITTRHSFAVDLVGKKDLSSAISLNAAAINGSRVLGPALGGLLLVPLGEGWCFALNGLSFLAIIFVLLAIDLEPRNKKVRLSRSWEHLGEAFEYLKKTPMILKFMGLSTFIALLGFSYTVLLPILAKEVLHGDSGTFAYLSSAGGLGAIVGAVFLAPSSAPQYLYRKIFTYVWAMGCGFILLGASHTIWLSVLAMFLVGCFMMGAFPIINSSIQAIVEDSMRGRVMSLYTMTFFGATPLGSLLVGGLADRFGTQRVAVGSGATCVLFGLCAPRVFGWIFRRSGDQVAGPVDFAAETGYKSAAAAGASPDLTETAPDVPNLSENL